MIAGPKRSLRSIGATVSAEWSAYAGAMRERGFDGAKLLFIAGCLSRPNPSLLSGKCARGQGLRRPHATEPAGMAATLELPLGAGRWTPRGLVMAGGSG